MLPSLPGEGRVPYIPPQPRDPTYSGRVVVPHEDGILEQTPYGSFLKLLCEEFTGDERFTLAERMFNPGAETDPIETDSEAIHILEGNGTLRVWLDDSPGSAMEIPVQPGLEVVITEGTRPQWVNGSAAPMLSVVTISHLPFPAYPHHYPAIFQPGSGNSLHMHDNRVEAFYVVEGPGCMSMADPDNKKVQDLMVPPRGVGYKPMYVYHRQFNPSTTQELCYWIHSMCVFTHRGSRLPQLHIRQHELDGKTPYWERAGAG